MNTQTDILARLLQLFPSQKIKDRWELKGKKEEVALQIAKSISPGEIKIFAKDSVGLTKQIICVRQPVKLANPKESILPGGELVSASSRDGVTEHFYLMELTYDVILQNPLEKTKLKFLWPVRVVFESDHFRVHITLMEKNVAAYFPADRSGISSAKSLEEWQIMDKICTGLGTKMEDSALDLNKGVKALWAKDLFDSLSARWKEAKDTTTKTMDKNCLLKKDNAIAYQSVIKAPLLKMGFKFLKKSDDYPDHFWCDPTKGELVISTFSENVSIAENVVREILKNN